MSPAVDLAELLAARGGPAARAARGPRRCRRRPCDPEQWRALYRLDAARLERWQAQGRWRFLSDGRLAITTA